MTRETVVVGGSIAQKPHQGGHTWQFLQYLLGFRRLGLDVLFVDRLTPAMGVGGDGVRYVADVMERFGLGDAFTLLGPHGGALAGVPRPEALARARRSILLLNVMGFLDDEDFLAAAPRRAFLDTDPGFGQMWRELGLADIFAGHDVHITIAENIGKPGCTVPTCGLDWLTTVQPVVLDEWRPNGNAADAPFTSVGAWRGPYAAVEYDGTTYGLRVHEFRRLAPLPGRTGERFAIALDIAAAEAADLALLRENGWRLLDPAEVARDPFAYREFVQASKAEFLVARGMYVRSRSGWFSERSICYLASGKPVLAQDTGLDALYEAGEGLLLYSTLDEAAAGVEEIAANYDRHARAARELAEERFGSDRVLTRLLEVCA
jgi:glycosyltransferase involved in cell wall biosynthesis